MIFRRQFCAAVADPETQRGLEGQLPPYATTRRSRDTERAVRLGGLSPMPNWGVRA